MMRKYLILAAALSMLMTFVTPASANCYLHCNPDGYGGTVCHWNCY
jgi:hypothetical protein